MSKLVLFLVGPTGSGKSKLALALAKKIGGEIISCDSMQVYRGMDIGTAKPSARERREVPHHLIDEVSPRGEFSVFRHRQLALRAIRRILKKGRIPIVVGGSGFYIKGILKGLVPQPGRQAKIRRRFEELAKTHGVKHLYSMLKKMDPKRAQAVHPNDKRRIIRALEICKTAENGNYPRSARPEIHAPRGMNLTGGEGLEALDFRPVLFGLERDRKELYERVSRRVDQMLGQGWIQEVKRLKRSGFSRTARAAIGYAEILDYLDGKGTLEAAVELIKRRTRHLVKKQFTWFRRAQNIQWIQVSGEKFLRSALQAIIRKLRCEGS